MYTLYYPHPDPRKRIDSYAARKNLSLDRISDLINDAVPKLPVSLSGISYMLTVYAQRVT